MAREVAQELHTEVRSLGKNLFGKRERKMNDNIEVDVRVNKVRWMQLNQGQSNGGL